MGESQEKEKKYGHLLAPIRDMASNWSIDIAKELEDYMEELDTLKISFDGGKTSMMFAEAALLIQAGCHSKQYVWLTQSSSN
jgi:condensin-2 complex subunit H2